MRAADSTGVRVREATMNDAGDVRSVFIASYGASYAYPRFYDEEALKRIIFGDDTLVLVAEDLTSGEIVGTASVILEIGAYADLVAEFGRLAVRPEERGKGVGGALMQGRLDRVQDRLHVGMVEARVTHPYSVKIALNHGFAPVGFLPAKLRLGREREHICVLIRLFGDAVTLRRNHPRVIPEAYRLACFAMEGLGMTPDVIVDENAPSYPRGGPYELEELSDTGYSSLLRIERGRGKRREVFGPLRLHYGFFKLRASHSDYLIARRGKAIAGAIGFMRDEEENHVKVFELIHTDPGAIRTLLAELETRCREWDVVSIEVGASAHAPGMQRTLLEAGYLPAAYLPAYAFHETERLDIVKMYRLLTSDVDLPLDVPEAGLDLATYVLDQFRGREVLPRIAAAVDRIRLFEGLNAEQRSRVAGAFGVRTFDVGERAFDVEDPADEMYVVLSGQLSITMPGGIHVGDVGPGESLGEVSLLTATPHSAAAVATEPVESGTLGGQALKDLTRQRPDIGMVLYRNLALGLGAKLRRIDSRSVEG